MKIVKLKTRFPKSLRVWEAWTQCTGHSAALGRLLKPPFLPIQGFMNSRQLCCFLKKGCMRNLERKILGAERRACVSIACSKHSPDSSLRFQHNGKPHIKHRVSSSSTNKAPASLKVVLVEKVVLEQNGWFQYTIRQSPLGIYTARSRHKPLLARRQCSISLASSYVQ